MKTKITLKLDADVLRQARTLAAEKGTSISVLGAKELEGIVRQRKGYDRAQIRALARLCKGLNLGWTRPRSRVELYGR